MFKFIEQLIFKIPCIKNVINEWKDCIEELKSKINWQQIDYDELQVKYLNLENKYKDLESKIYNTAFFYLNIDQIWALPEWSCVDGPCEYRIEHTEDKFLKIYYSSKLNADKYFALDYQTVLYHRIKIEKNGQIKFYWKYCP